MQKRAILTAIVSGVVATGAFFACGGGGAGGSGDSGGGGGNDASLDMGVTLFEASAPDTYIAPPDVGRPHRDSGKMTPDSSMGADTGLEDVRVDQTAADAHAPHDAGADAHKKHHDAGVDSSKGHDSGTDSAMGTDSGACTVVGVPATMAGAATCPTTSPGTCGPQALTSFTPNAPPPSGKGQNKCTTAQIQSIYDDCLSGAQLCPESDEGNAALPCYNCIFTNSTDLTWGPAVLTPGSVEVNLGGCVSLLEPCNSACADAIEYDFQCDNAACQANCPVTADAGSLTAFEGCAMTADGCDPNGCYLYANGAYSAGGCIEQMVQAPAAHPATTCFPSAQTFEASFLAVSGVFCGPP
jgi:hypothetical protein